MLAYLKVYRPLNLLFIGIAQFLASYYLYFDAEFIEIWNRGVGYLLLGTLSIAAFAYWLNDFYDAERDALNGRNRLNVKSLNPLVLIIHLLSFLSLILWSANHLSLLLSMCFAIAILCLWLYNYFLKDFPLIGNVLIALLSFLSVYMVGWLFPEIDKRLLLHFGMLAAMINFCRELVKDAEDEEGDRLTGAKTIAVLWGNTVINRIVYFSILFIISFTIMSLYYQKQYFAAPLLYVYWLYYLLFVIIPLYSIALKIKFISEKQEYSDLSSQFKYILFTGILSILFF